MSDRITHDTKMAFNYKIYKRADAFNYNMYRCKGYADHRVREGGAFNFDYVYDWRIETYFRRKYPCPYDDTNSENYWRREFCINVLKYIARGNDCEFYDAYSDYSDDDGVQHSDVYHDLRADCEHPIAVSRRLRIRTHFREKVWPELMAAACHPSRIDQIGAD